MLLASGEIAIPDLCLPVRVRSRATLKGARVKAGWKARHLVPHCGVDAKLAARSCLEVLD